MFLWTPVLVDRVRCVFCQNVVYMHITSCWVFFCFVIYLCVANMDLYNGAFFSTQVVTSRTCDLAVVSFCGSVYCVGRGCF